MFKIPFYCYDEVTKPKYKHSFKLFIYRMRIRQMTDNEDTDAQKLYAILQKVEKLLSMKGNKISYAHKKQQYH